MTRELILKRYERGMTVEQIAAVDDLTLAHVEEVISSSGVQPVERKKLETSSTLVTDDEIKRRIEEGETRYAIEMDFNLTPGSLMHRVNRIFAEQDGQDEPKVRGRKPKVSDEHLIEYVNSGKTCMEIARIMKASHSSMKKRLERLEIFEKAEQNKSLQSKETEPRVFVSIDFECVERLLRRGMTLPQIAKEIGIKYNTLLKRMKRKPELKVLANETAKEVSRRSIEEINAAKREVAVTTESDGFEENYTIAHMTKEEADMTEAIAEVKQETEERNDKWVHFVANQIDNARVKTKFDVVDRGGKLVKQTEVRFVIEEVL